MYAKYSYAAGASPSNLLADVVAILTGETNKANLSADCVQANTAITSTVASGWTVHDAAAGTNAQVLKAPLADDGTTFKYIKIDCNTAGYLKIGVYETWDATGHTGTNMAYNSENTTSHAQRVDLTSGGIMHIFASARFAVMCAQYGAAWGNSASGPSGCVERTRLLTYDTVANGWPPFMYMEFASSAAGSDCAWHPRLMKRDRSEQIGTNTNCKTSSVATLTLSAQGITGVDQKVPDAADGTLVPFFPIYVGAVALMPAPYGEISSLCDIWWLPQSLASSFDVVTKDAIEYMAMQASTTAGKMFVFRKS